jgi:hypothetical protein
MMRLCQNRQSCKGLVFLGVGLVALAASGVLAAWVAAGVPAASGAASALIGTLEGPEVIAEPAQFPKKFSCRRWPNASAKTRW